MAAASQPDRSNLVRVPNTLASGFQDGQLSHRELRLRCDHLRHYDRRIRRVLPDAAPMLEAPEPQPTQMQRVTS